MSRVSQHCVECERWAHDYEAQAMVHETLAKDVEDLKADRDELQLAYDALMSVVDQQKRGMDEAIAERDDTVERIAAWLNKRAAYWHQRFPSDKSIGERADVLVDMADAIRRGDWKNKT